MGKGGERARQVRAGAAACQGRAGAAAAGPDDAEAARVEWGCLWARALGLRSGVAFALDPLLQVLHTLHAHPARIPYMSVGGRSYTAYD